MNTHESIEQWFLFLTGVIVFGIIASWALPLPALMPSSTQWAILLAGALAGLIGRGVRRKIALGKDITLHQACSFEIIVQAFQMVGPWLSNRALESAFIRRETGLAEYRTNQWLNARIIGTRTVSIGAFALIAWLYALPGPALALGITALAVLVVGSFRRRVTAAGVLAALFGILVWLVEGYAFFVCFADLLPANTAVISYLLFTGALELTPYPLGIGWAQLPAWVFPQSQPVFLAICSLHLLRLGLLALFSLVYLPRYKIGVQDLTNPNVITIMLQRLRPPQGWDMSEALPRGAPEISLVIPAYNEEKRLPAFLDSVQRYLNGRPKLRMEVLVVDDGSKDRTADVVEGIAKADPRIKLVRQIPNQGKGAAVRRGMLEAAGRFILFADADGATPITELDRMLPVMSEAEIIIGSRKVQSEELTRQRVGLRELMGSTFYRIVNLFAVPGIKDTQCGFKMFRRDAARRLFSVAEEKGWAFDVEVLFLAQLVGFAIREVGVNWEDKEGSKINPFQDALKMFVAIFRIRRRHSGFCQEV